LEHSQLKQAHFCLKILFENQMMCQKVLTP
jgi:hypothetical protein